jgi:hypothetical protein
MKHSPQQFEAMVAIGAKALLKLPDEERAALLTEMRTFVFRCAAETYGMLDGWRYCEAFANEVGRRVNLEAERRCSERPVSVVARRSFFGAFNPADEAVWA